MSKIQLHAFIVIVLLGSTIAGATVRRPLTNPKPPQIERSRIPLEIGGWYGTEDDFPEDMKKQLPSCSFLLRHYEHTEGRVPVELAVVYGSNLGDFHQPQVCLTGQGWDSVSEGLIRIRDGDGKYVEAVKAVMEDQFGVRAVFIFWFYTKGSVTTSLGRYKLEMLKERILTGNVRPAAMIRLHRQVLGDDEEAVDELVRFSETMLPYLRKEFVEGADQRQE